MKATTKRTIKFALITGAILLALAGAALAGMYLWLSPYEDYPYIFPNVSYDGINLGGLTKEEATRSIDAMLSTRSYSLQVQFPDGQTYTLEPQQHVINQNSEGVVNAAYEYGRAGGNAYNTFRAVRAAENSSYEIPVSNVIEYDQGDLRNQVDHMIDRLTVLPQDVTGTGDNDAKTVSVTPGAPGRTADGDAIFAAACEAYNTGVFTPLSADYEEITIDKAQLTAVVTSLHSRFAVEPTETRAITDSGAHSARIVKGTVGYDFDSQALIDTVLRQTEQGNFDTVTVTMEETTPADADVKKLCQSLIYDPTPVEYHDGELTGGDPGYTLDIESAQAQVDALSWGESCTLEMTEVAPEISKDEVEAVLFRDVLGSYSTAHTYDSNRTNNLRLACQEIDGIIMNPGRVFSFNTFVGERTAEKGYRKAIVYVDGDEEADDGGGVCQVVSTLYNAALLADMEITDRACHQFQVTYVPGGLDATVYWGVQDFCFMNNTNYPIKIEASVANGLVNIVIYGTNVTGKSVSLESRFVSSDADSISYEGYQYVYENGYLVDQRSLGVDKYDLHKN